MLARFILAGLALVMSTGAARAEGGTLVIVGGGLDPANADIFAALLDARPDGAPGIAIIPAASGESGASSAAFTAALQRHGAKPQDIVTIRLAAIDDPGTPDEDEGRAPRRVLAPGQPRQSGAVRTGPRAPGGCPA